MKTQLSKMYDENIIILDNLNAEMLCFTVYVWIPWTLVKQDLKENKIKILVQKSLVKILTQKNVTKPHSETVWVYSQHWQQPQTCCHNLIWTLQSCNLCTEICDITFFQLSPSHFKPVKKKQLDKLDAYIFVS